MYAEDPGHVVFFYYTAFAYFLRTAEGLFGRLEYQQYIVIQVLGFVYIFSEGQHHGHMSVVAACVHFPFVGGSVAAIIRFAYRKSVHIGPETVSILCSSVEKCAYAAVAEECEGAVQLFENGEKIFFRLRKISVQLRYHMKAAPVIF